MEDDEKKLPEEQTANQRKAAFANSVDMGILVQLLRESCHKGPLVGETEYETVVNAVRLDSQSDLINEFINQIDTIKKGGLFNAEQ